MNIGADSKIAIIFGIPSSLLENLYVKAIVKLKNNPSPNIPYIRTNAKILLNNVLYRYKVCNIESIDFS